MPLYNDSVIAHAVGDLGTVVAHYGLKAVKVTAASRPSTIIDVWVVEPEDAETLRLYRGEYKLGIITSAGHSRKDYEVGNFDTRLHALSGSLNQGTSKATRALLQVREQLPQIERLVREQKWEQLDASTLSVPELDTETSDLASFAPFIDLYNRLVTAWLLFYGFTVDKNNVVTVVSPDRFFHYLVGGSDGKRYDRLYAFLRSLNFMPTVKGMATELKKLLLPAVNSEDYKFSPDARKTLSQLLA